ncbi:MAG: hypothetical protein J6V40_02695 [Clostridia bacterium]|nr:hypothetical protein [Clostridia bacterium]
MKIFNNYKEQNAELKRLKKERKLLKRSQKPKEYYQTRTISIVLFTLLLIFAFTISPIISILGSLDGVSFDYLEELTKNYTDELEKPTDPENLIKYSKIEESDYLEFYNTMVDNNINFFNSDKGLNLSKLNNYTTIITSEFCLSSEALGAFINNMVNTSDTSSLNPDDDVETIVKSYSVEILEISIYEENEATYMYSSMSIPLNELFNTNNLPDIYLSTTSKITIEDNKIVASEYFTRINELDDQTNKDVLAIFNAILQLTDISANNINTVIISSIIEDLALKFDATLSLENNQFKFSPSNP